MAQEIRSRFKTKGGLSTERPNVLLLSKEQWVNTDNKKLYVGDGVTLGGNPVIAELAPSGVAAGTYQHGNLSVNQQGIITAVETLTPGMRNRLINGDFSIWQRGANAIPTVSRSRTNGVQTYTTDRPHGYVVGDVIQITGVGGSIYNIGFAAVYSTPTATTFTVNWGSSTTLSGAITNSQTSITVSSNMLVPYVTLPFNIQIDSEQMTVTSVGSSPYTAWTVTRGVNGTTAAAHNSGAAVYPADETTTADTGGRCLITNRPSFAIVAGGSMYTADRWIIINETEQPCVVSRQDFTPGQTAVPGEPKSYLQVSFASAPTTGDVYVDQKIESVRTLAGKMATISCYYKAPVSTKFRAYEVQYCDTASIQNIIINQTNNVADWQKAFGTLLIPSLAGQTLGPNNYLQVRHVLTPRALGAYYLALIQLEEGSVATPFEQRHPATELALCQRYYEKSCNQDNVPGRSAQEGRVIFTARYADTSDRIYVYYKTTKRANTTVNIYAGGSGAQGKIRDWNGNEKSAITLEQNQNNFILSPTEALTANIAYSFSWTADAEL